MKYHDVVYGNYPKSTYPRKLAWKLIWDYMRDSHRGFRVKGGVEKCIGDKILDVGCGTGEMVERFKSYGYQAYGVDSEIDLNKDKLPFRDSSFEYVFTKSTIEHIQNTNHFLTEIRRVLKPGGKLIVLTPSWQHNMKDFYNDYTHVRPFHRKGLQDALRINGFNNVNVEYFYHLPWLWGRPWLMPIVKILSLCSKWKWRNKEENIHRPNIRFAQEVQLLGLGIK